jgi:hypothetical protein
MIGLSIGGLALSATTLVPSVAAPRAPLATVSIRSVRHDRSSNPRGAPG